MCVLLILKDRLEGHPWVVAANRDEEYDRPSRPPGPVRGPLRLFCGLDLRSGGTWLGVNEKGLIAVITNRPGGDDDPSRPSRGRIPLAVLLQPDLDCAAAVLRDLEKDRTPWTISSWEDGRDRHVAEAPRRSETPYNPFNLFVAQGARGFVAHNDGEIELREVTPGVHTLTNHHDLDRLRAGEILDRIGRERVWRREERGELVRTLQEVLGRHDGVGPEPYVLCKHGRERGTVSSTILAVGDDFPRDALLLHSEGSPCKDSYFDLAPHLGSTF